MNRPLPPIFCRLRSSTSVAARGHRHEFTTSAHAIELDCRQRRDVFRLPERQRALTGCDADFHVAISLP